MGSCFIKPVRGHYEVITGNGCVVCSGDTEDEAVDTFMEILKERACVRCRA